MNNGHLMLCGCWFVCYGEYFSLQNSLISWLLKLSCACLSFDFIGTSTDESADDLATVQIPTSWRSIFLDSLTLQLYFDLFHNLSSELAAMVSIVVLPACFSTPLSLPQSLTCLVQLASVRRSLFTNTERGTFLMQLVKGVRSILEQPQVLSVVGLPLVCPLLCSPRPWQTPSVTTSSVV